MGGTPPRSKEVCRRWQRGHCRFGGSCKSSHDAPQDQKSDVRTTQRGGSQSRGRSDQKGVCRNFWLTGSCSNNPCSYRHLTHEQVVQLPKTDKCPLCFQRKQRQSHNYCMTHFRQHVNRSSTSPSRNNRGNFPPVDHARLDVAQVTQAVVAAPVHLQRSPRRFASVL